MSEPALALRAVSLRVTRQRVAVLAVLRGNGHVDAERIRRLVARDIGSISLQAVYDVVAVLARAGLIRRLELPGSPVRFELRVEAHDHLVCRHCGAVDDLESGSVAVPPAAAPDHGYRIDEIQTTYWGLCPSCLPATAPSAGTSR